MNRLSTAGAAINRDFAIVNMGNGNTSSNAWGASVEVVVTSNTGTMQTYICHISAHFSGGVGVFNAGTVLAIGTAIGAVSAPAITWVGAGDQRTARLTLNQLNASNMLVYRIADRANATVSFVP